MYLRRFLDTHGPESFACIAPSPRCLHEEVQTRVKVSECLSMLSTGLGCECGSSVHVNFGGKRLLPDPVLSRELGASERIAFVLPHLVDNERAMDIPLSIEVTSSDGSSQRSTEYLWQYEAPAIEQVHLSAGPAVGINILTIIGRNFGGERNLNSTRKTTNSILAGGEVLLLSGDGSEACSTCYLPKADTGRSYITSWSHTRITAFYTGNFVSSRFFQEEGLEDCIHQKLSSTTLARPLSQLCKINRFRR